jgi:hypothetical protein
MMEETMRPNYNPRQSYLDYLLNSSQRSRIDEEDQQWRNNYKDNTAHFALDGIILREPASFRVFNQAPPLSKSFIILQVLSDHDNIFNFKKIFVFDNQYLVLHPSGVFKTFHNALKKIQFGRSPEGFDCGTLNIKLGSDLCSRYHFSIGFGDFFQSKRVSLGLLYMKHVFGTKVTNKTFICILGYLGIEKNEVQVLTVTEEKSIIGTWLNIGNSRHRLCNKDQLKLKEHYSMTIKAIHHKEYNHFLTEVTENNIYRENLNQMDRFSFMNDMMSLFRSAEFVFSNHGMIDSNKYNEIIKHLMDHDVYFSCLLFEYIDHTKEKNLNTSVFKKNKEKSFVLVICVNCIEHRFEMELITIDFYDKSFWLTMNDYNGARGIIDFWKAVGYHDGERYSNHTQVLRSSETIKVNNSIIKLSSRHHKK